MQRSVDPEEIPAEAIQEEVERLSILREAIEVERDMRAEKSTPLRLILDEAREDAVDALRELIAADPAEISVVRELQYKVRRYADLNAWIRTILDRGKEAQADQTPEESAEDATFIESMLKDEPQGERE